MKILSIFLVIAFTSQLNAQRSEFVDYLLQLQYATDPLYDYMLNEFNEARAQLSVLLTEINDDSVREITTGLRDVIEIRDRLWELADFVSDDERYIPCLNSTLETFDEELEVTGAAISRCSGVDLERLNTDVNRIHSFLLENNALKFEVQNLVLSIFREHNPMEGTETVTSLVEQRIDEIETQFNTQTKSEIEALLTNIQQLRFILPEEIHHCVNVDVNRFNIAALELMDALYAC